MKDVNTVEDFKNFWLNAGCPILPPFECPIHITDIAYALCIYRAGPFQVEMYLCKPNTETTVHTHPGVDHLSMYLTGNLEFARSDGKFTDLSAYQKEGKLGAHMLLGKSSPAAGDEAHALRIGPEGGALLVFEKWANGKPTSISVAYDGDLLGEKHEQTIARAA